MKENITPIEYDILSTIRVSLRMSIVRDWSSRQDPFFRKEIRQAVKALRVMRNTQSLHQEKFPWSK